MEIEKMLNELRGERDQLVAAIGTLERLAATRGQAQRTATGLDVASEETGTSAGKQE